MNIANRKKIESNNHDLVFPSVESASAISFRNLTFQEGISPNLTTLYPRILKSDMEEKYSNIQEQLSEITRINNQERKEHTEIQKEKDNRINQLQKEKDQLSKKLARAEARAKSYKDELDLKKARADIEDLLTRMTIAEVELGIKKEGK